MSILLFNSFNFDYIKEWSYLYLKPIVHPVLWTKEGDFITEGSFSDYIEISQFLPAFRVNDLRESMISKKSIVILYNSINLSNIFILGNNKIKCPPTVGWLRQG